MRPSIAFPITLRFVAAGLLLTACASVTTVPTHLDQQIDHPWSQSDISSTMNQSIGSATDGTTVVDKVFVQCVVTQGNGYNWAATLGWLAGQVDLVATRAEAYEAAHPGKMAAIDLACMTGSSSGGAAASLYDHLLANPRLVGSRPGTGPQLLTSQQARAISEALMFLALSTDFRRESVALALTAVGAYSGQLDRASQGEPAAYWRARSTPARNQAIFGKWIKAAYLYEPSWFDELVGNDPLSIPTFRQRPMTLDDATREQAEQRMQYLSSRARRMMDERTKGQPFEQQPLGDGICVTSLAVPMNGGQLPFELDDLILIVGCNGATFEQLVDEPFLQNLLASSSRADTRLRVASAGSWQTLLNLTVREPELITPLSGQLLAEPIALKAIAAFANGMLSPIEPMDNYLMLGGFASPRMQAWPATALLLGRLSTLHKRGVSAEGRIALFGLTEDRSNPNASFAQRTIADYFTVNAGPDRAATDKAATDKAATDSAETLKAYYAWQDEYCSATVALNGPVKIDFFRMNWNLPGGPAAIKRRSRELAAMGYNLVKLQLEPERYPDVDRRWLETLLFANADDHRYVPPLPAAGMSCQPNSVAVPTADFLPGK